MATVTIDDTTTIDPFIYTFNVTFIYTSSQAPGNVNNLIIPLLILMLSHILTVLRHLRIQ